MNKNLFELFIDAYEHACLLPWRIYGNHTHRLLCKDYRELRGFNRIDNMKVIKCTKMRNYWRITVVD